MKTKTVTLRDLIVWDKDFKPDFPTFSSCIVCGGITSCGGWETGKTDDKELATQAALVYHGYMVAKWEGSNFGNRDNFPYKCTCTCKAVEKLDSKE